MRKKNRLVLFILLSLFHIVAGQENRKIIIIDSGHGGRDSGAISNFGLEEKDVAMDIANYILYWNKVLYEDKFDFYLTRNTDTLISLDDRAKLAKHLKPDLFISLHCNHSDDNRNNGIGIFVYKRIKKGNDAEIEMQLSKTILKEIHGKLGLNNAGIRHGNFHVIRESSEVCPSILLEMGFLSNEVESNYLAEKKKKSALALAIIMALSNIL